MDQMHNCQRSYEVLQFEAGQWLFVVAALDDPSRGKEELLNTENPVLLSTCLPSHVFQPALCPSGSLWQTAPPPLFPINWFLELQMWLLSNIHDSTCRFFMSTQSFYWFFCVKMGTVWVFGQVFPLAARNAQVPRPRKVTLQISVV